jgi:hypothetical protein
LYRTAETIPVQALRFCFSRYCQRMLMADSGLLLATAEGLGRMVAEGARQSKLNARQ